MTGLLRPLQAALRVTPPPVAGVVLSTLDGQAVIAPLDGQPALVCTIATAAAIVPGDTVQISGTLITARLSTIAPGEVLDV